MKEAEELRNEIHRLRKQWIEYGFIDYITHNDELLNLINQFKKEVCEKQRENCVNIRHESGVYAYVEDVMNAPEPE